MNVNVFKKYINEIIICTTFFTSILCYNLNTINHALFYEGWSKPIGIASFLVLIISTYIYLYFAERKIDDKRLFMLFISLICFFLISIPIVKSNYFKEVKIYFALNKISKMEKDYANSTEYNEIKNLIINGKFPELYAFDKKRLNYKELSFIDIMLIKENDLVKEYYNEVNKDGFLNQVELENIDLKINEYLLKKLKD